MWQEGKTTVVFESILDGLFARGFSVVALVKKRKRFMNLAPYFGIRPSLQAAKVSARTSWRSRRLTPLSWVILLVQHNNFQRHTKRESHT